MKKTKTPTTGKKLTEIDKELIREKNKKKMRVVYAIIYVVALYVYFHYAYTKEHYGLYTGKKIAFTDIVNETLKNLINPFCMSISADSLMVVIVLTGVVIGAAFMMKSNAEYKKHDNPDTVKGEAHLMNVTELQEYNVKFSAPFGVADNNGPENMIISKDIRLAMVNNRTHRNCNILCIGGSGAGKSRFFAGPNILQYNCNFVITDPSGELLRDYGKGLEDNGYHVKVFNLTDVYRSNRYNPFHYIKEEKDVFVLVDTLIKNTTPSNASSGDPFWEKAETLLLNALVLYLWHKCEEKDQTFSHVLRLINMAQIDENNPNTESPLDVLFKELEEEDTDNLAVEQYKLFKIGAGKTLKSILISVGVRLNKFRLSDIQYLTQKDDFQLEKFADSRQAIFMILPSGDTTFNFIVSMLYTQLFMSLYTYSETTAKYGWVARVNDYSVLKTEQAKSGKDSQRAKAEMEAFIDEVKNGVITEYDEKKRLYYVYTKKNHLLVGWRGTEELTREFIESLKNIKMEQCSARCPNHVRMILDEFANIGEIPDFDPRLATMRKYEISCSIILQALSQLKDLYKDKANTIIGNCDTKLFLGCDDTETIKWLLEMLGKKTITVMNTSVNSKDKSGSTSYNKDSIDLLTIDQITMMQDDECIVRIRGVQPYYGKKYELTEHPNYAYAQSVRGMFEIPIAEEAKNRKTGPLWKRKLEKKERLRKEQENKKNGVSLNKEADIEKENNKNVSRNNSEQNQKKYIPIKKENPVQKLKAAKNVIKKEKGQQAKVAYQNYDEKNMPDEVEQKEMEELLNGFGVQVNSTEEEIKEAVETVLELQNLDISKMKFVETN